MSVSRVVIQMVSDHFQGDVYGTGFAEPRPKEAVLTFWPRQAARTYAIQSLRSQIVISNPVRSTHPAIRYD